MSRAKLGLAFLRRLFLGEDWQLTAVPLAALAVTALLHQHGFASWWLLPATVALALTGSIRRVIKRRGTPAITDAASPAADLIDVAKGACAPRRRGTGRVSAEDAAKADV